MPVVRTVGAPLRHEIAKVKGSRFIASLAPIGDAEAARALVAASAETFRDASHHCFAWRLRGDQSAFRYHDAGEPSGTAGRPILQEIDGRGLLDVAVVVSRYFGGTKLGTGGLIRAYGGAAAAALDAAAIVEVPVVERFALAFDYRHTGAVKAVLTAFALRPAEADYGAAVRLTLAVPVEDAERLARALRDATAGTVAIARGG